MSTNNGPSNGDDPSPSGWEVTLLGLYDLSPPNGTSMPTSPTGPPDPAPAPTAPSAAPPKGTTARGALRLSPRRQRFVQPGVEPYLTVNEVCANYAVDRSTLYRWLADPDSGLDEIAVRNPGGGRWRFPADRFREWFDGANRRRGRRGGRDAE